MRKHLSLVGYCFVVFAVAAPAITQAQSFDPAVYVKPFNPRPGVPVRAVILPSSTSCVSLDKIERIDHPVDKRVVITVSKSWFFTGLGCVNPPDNVDLGSFGTGKYTVEVSLRTPELSSRDTVIGRTSFLVSPANLDENAPAKIEVVGPTVIVKNLSGTNAVGGYDSAVFRVSDNLGRPTWGTGYRVDANDAAGTSVVRCTNYSGCGSDLSNESGTISTALIRPSSSKQAQILTWTIAAPGSSFSNGPAAYITTGYVDEKRRSSVLPVVEYELSTTDNTAPTYFLATAESDMKTLDDQPGAARRTFAAFFGVRDGTPGAQPVCRFVKRPVSGVFYHWFTVDAAECAAKRADSTFIYEGTPFWAYPARADGGCPRDTRGVTRYLYVSSSGNNFSSVMGTRHTMLTSAKELAGAVLSQSDLFGGTRLTFTDGGTAFCVPD